ncbi:hypothetical protein FRC11_006669 [Ceratobasidium sp. 423]|nr:hypothetical protein FRC11_006669 [Ceratobasidium sp. 423]
MFHDLSDAIWSQVRIWGAASDTIEWFDTYIVEWTARAGEYCRSGGVFNVTCGGMTDEGRRLRWYGTTDDYGRDPSFIAPFNVTITNSLIALRDAIMIDLGNANISSNIYLNKTYFNEVIRVDPYHVEAGNTLINHPGGAPTVTILSTLYALFDLYMPKVETHYQRRRQAFAQAINRNIEDQGDEECSPVGNPLYRAKTSDSSNTLYDPVPQTEKDKNGRYD